MTGKKLRVENGEVQDADEEEDEETEEETEDEDEDGADE